MFLSVSYIKIDKLFESISRCQQLKFVENSTSVMCHNPSIPSRIRHSTSVQCPDYASKLYWSGIVFQGAILTTMLATRNFSSKYDVQGRYLTGSSGLNTRQYSISVTPVLKVATALPPGSRPLWQSRFTIMGTITLFSMAYRQQIGNGVRQNSSATRL